MCGSCRVVSSLVSCFAPFACFGGVWFSPLASCHACLSSPLVVVVQSFWLPLLFMFSPFSPFVFVACGAFFLRAGATWPGDFFVQNLLFVSIRLPSVCRESNTARTRKMELATAESIRASSRSPCTSMIIGCLGALRILNSCLPGRFFYPSALCCFCCFLVRF